MVERIIKLPDVGEGIAEAELVEWHVKVGDLVREDTVLAAVMTDKATVEIPSPVEGEVVWLGAEIGDAIAIGSALVRMKVAAGANEPAKPKSETVEVPVPVIGETHSVVDANAVPLAATVGPASLLYEAVSPVHIGPLSPVRRSPGEKPLASPSVRLRAREAGMDLRLVAGSGPAGRIIHEDLDAFAGRAPNSGHALGLFRQTPVKDIKVVGMRRKIAEKMSLSKSRIPHITIVEEVDVSALEDLRAVLNNKPGTGRPKLTLLPFLMRAMVKAIAEQPNLNALYDDDAGLIHQHAGVHIGIATQTASGLVVPVVKHAEARDIWDCGAEVIRLAELARTGKAARDELGGSTITITSLGALGGIATTPVINYPEVAIVGVNKMMIRPMWDGTAFVKREMMNLSSSFDHRVIDGWDAALFVQRIKAFIETPATIFLDV